MMMMNNMEVCFLGSNSTSIKTLTKFPISSRKSYSHYHDYQSHQKSFNQCPPNGTTYSRGCTLFPLKCCNDGTSKSSIDDDEDYKPSIEGADWRSFRSMLMATETATKPSPENGSSNWSDFITKTDHHKHVKKHKRWAHILHRPETGCLLIAMDKLNGVHIFERTAILLLSMEHRTGPIGVILNRPLSETQSTVGDDLDIKLDNPSFYGGPFNEKIFLVGPKRGGDELMEKSWGLEEVMQGFYYGREKENVEEMVRRGGVGIEGLRFFDGCVKWEKKKLEEEIRDGYWKVIACSPTMMGLA